MRDMPVDTGVVAPKAIPRPCHGNTESIAGNRVQRPVRWWVVAPFIGTPLILPGSIK